MANNIRTGWGRIVLHVILPAGLTVVLFVCIIFGVIIPKFRNCALNEKRQLIKELVSNVNNLLEHYHQRQLSGELSKAEAQQRVLDRIRAMRYGPENKNYFWVHTLEPVMVMHPYRQDLVGEDITDLRDSRGKRFILDMNQKVKSSPTHDGYVDYYWQWNDVPQEDVPKLSYVRLFEPWGWVIGTGIYLDDVHAEVDAITDAFQRNLLLAGLVIAIICGYLIVHGIRGEMQRQDSQQRLREAFERFKTVMDSLTSYVIVSDINTLEILFLNQNAKQDFGDGIGKTCWQVFECEPNSPCGFCPDSTLLLEASAQPQGYQLEFQYARTNRWYEARLQKIRWVDGRAALLEIAADITSRKNVEHEREKLLKSLAIKNEELESVVYIASHDLRSPLINIQGFTGELESSMHRLNEILRTNEALAEQEQLKLLLVDDIPEALSFIKAGTDKMQMLVNGLLQLSRLGIAHLNIRTLDMAALMDAVVSACRYQISRLNATVTYDGLPACCGDEKLVNQVFTNLIDNALKYAHPERPPRIEITGRTVNGQVEYAVSDNGVGIEEEYLTKIFDMFCQCSTQNGKIDGVGLGLTIVKRILDILDGQIRVESEYGKGSVFYVKLPAGS